MDLFKPYDSLPPYLLVAKFEAYVIDKNGLNLIHIYLRNRKQKTKASYSYSDYYGTLEVFSKVEFQAHYFLTFILMISFHLLKEQIYSISLMIIQTILRDLKYDMQNILKWFKVNSMKPNLNKFQFPILSKSTR